MGDSVTNVVVEGKMTLRAVSDPFYQRISTVEAKDMHPGRGETLAYAIDESFVEMADGQRVNHLLNAQMDLEEEMPSFLFQRHTPFCEGGQFVASTIPCRVLHVPRRHRPSVRERVRIW